MKRGDLLNDAVDKGLSLLGEEAKKILYRRLARDYGISNSDISARFNEFSAALNHILGPGANILVRLIVEEFSRKTDEASLADKIDYADPDEVTQGYVTQRDSTVRHRESAVRREPVLSEADLRAKAAPKRLRSLAVP